MADSTQPMAAAPVPVPKVSGFKAICMRAFAGHLLGSQDRLRELLQGTQLPEGGIRHMLDPEVDDNDEVDEATCMTATVLIAQDSGLPFERMMFEFGRFWMPFACEKAGYLESCIHQVASNFDDYARQHTQVVSHLFGLVCKDKPVQAHVSQPSPSGPLHLGMVVEDPRQAGFAVRIVSMYCGMLKWVAEQVFLVDVTFSALESTPLPGGAVYQSCRIEYTHGSSPGPASTASAAPGSPAAQQLPQEPQDGTTDKAAPSLVVQGLTEQLGVDPCSFAELFPFHFVLDQDLGVVQAGQALKKMLPALEQHGVNIADVLTMRSPRNSLNADTLSIVLGNPKGKVVLGQHSGGAELRGGLYRVKLSRRTCDGRLLEGGDATLFLGSPCLTSVEEMRALGLFMSDYPTHDPTADETLVAAARKVLVTERLQEAEHNASALKRTLAQTLVSHREAVPALNVESAGHRLLDLLDSLLVGEEVDTEALLAARATLLKAGGSLWKPLEVDWSAVGGDKEVNQSLACMLGTGGASDNLLDSQPGGSGNVGYLGSAALRPLNVAGAPRGAEERRGREWDSSPSCNSPRSPATSGGTRIGLAAYRRASASRSHLMTAPDVMEAAMLQSAAAAAASEQGSGAASPRAPAMPAAAAARSGRMSEGAGDSGRCPGACAGSCSSPGTALAAAAEDGCGAKRHLGAHGLRMRWTSLTGAKSRERGANWLQSLVSALKTGKLKSARASEEAVRGGSQSTSASLPPPGPSTGRPQQPTSSRQRARAAGKGGSCRVSFEDSPNIPALPGQTSVPMQLERSLAGSGQPGPSSSSTGDTAGTGATGASAGASAGAAAGAAAGTGATTGAGATAGATLGAAATTSSNGPSVQAPGPPAAHATLTAAQSRPLKKTSSAHISAYILLLPPTDQVAALLRGVDEWQFDTFALDQATGGRPLSFLAFHLFSRVGLVERLHLDAIKLSRFLMHIEDGYGDNPYHCRVHAADVLRSLHVVLHRGGVLRATAKHITGVAMSQLREEEEHAAEAARMQLLLRCYLAAIVHDYEHRGVNNDFLIRSSDPLALLYNDMSPLEMHHASAALTLLQQPDFAFLASASTQHFALTGSFTLKLVTSERQKVAVVAASATSIARRSRGAGQGAGGEPRLSSSGQAVENRFSSGGHAGEARSSSGGHLSCDALLEVWDADTELLVLKMALKAADLGHLTSGLGVHKRWVTRLEQELFLQGDRERALGQPISPLMDRAKSGIQRSQTGFFSVVAQPMYAALAHVFPDCQALVDNLSLNLTHWKAVEAAGQVSQ